MSIQEYLTEINDTPEDELWDIGPSRGPYDYRVSGFMGEDVIALSLFDEGVELCRITIHTDHLGYLTDCLEAVMASNHVLRGEAP